MIHVTINSALYCRIFYTSLYFGGAPTVKSIQYRELAFLSKFMDILVFIFAKVGNLRKTLKSHHSIICLQNRDKKTQVSKEL